MTAEEIVTIIKDRLLSLYRSEFMDSRVKGTGIRIDELEKLLTVITEEADSREKKGDH